MPLLRSQEAWIFEQVTGAGFDPREFTLQDGMTQQDTRPAPILTHRLSGFYFAFAQNPARGGFWVEFSPGVETLIGSYGTGDWYGLVRREFIEWLIRLRRELGSPDLWGELRRESELLGGEPAAAENTPFAPEELAEIQRHLAEAKELIRANHDLPQAQLNAIDARLDYLADAATRMGRVDWRELLVGSMLSLVLQAVVPPEPIRDALSFITRVAGHLFGIEVPGLPSA